MSTSSSSPLSASPRQITIALIGAGTMGSRIAARLLAAGHALTVYNRSPGRVNALRAAGATVAPTITAAVNNADVVFTCLRGDEAEVEAMLGPAGALAALPRTGLHVALSTLSPETATSIAAAHRRHGSHFLCAQMQGRAQAAESGQLLLWTSGALADLTSVRPVLDGFASQVVHLGEGVEMAPAMKLAVNMLMFANIELFAETSAYLQRCGIDAKSVLQRLTETVFATPLFRGIAASLNGSHAPDGTSVATALCDLQLLIKHADGMGARLPAAWAVARHYADTAESGHAHLSQSAVILPLLPT